MCAMANTDDLTAAYATLVKSGVPKQPQA